jgi:hypothetical protein
MAATEQAIRRQLGRELRAQIRTWRAERASLQNAMQRILVLDALIARAEDTNSPLSVIAEPDETP